MLDIHVNVYVERDQKAIIIGRKGSRLKQWHPGPARTLRSCWPPRVPDLHRVHRAKRPAVRPEDAGDASASDMPSVIRVRGARVHNLKTTSTFLWNTFVAVARVWVG